MKDAPEISVYLKAWSFLDAHERRTALAVLGLIVVAGVMSAVMVGSIFPFLSVLSDPEQIESSRMLSWMYAAGDFEDNYRFLVALGFLSIAVIVTSNLVMLLRVYVVGRFTYMRMHSISRRLLAAYLGQPYEFFLSRNSGELGTQILAETQLVVRKFLVPLADSIASAVTILCIVALLFFISPGSTAVAFGLFGGIYGLALLVSRRLVARLGRKRARSNKARFKAAGEALAGIKDIKLSGKEAPFLAKYSRPSRKMARTLMIVKVIGETPQYVMQILASGGMVALCLFMLDPASLTQEATLSGIEPLLGLFAFAAQRLIPELSRLYRSITTLQYGSAAVHALHADFYQSSQNGAPIRGGDDRLRLQEALVFDGVSYTYPGSDHSGLSDINLTIRAGEKIGIVGGTGAGKTTLADIILGLLSPASGQMIADTALITKDNIRSWWGTVGYVPQQIFLTDGSVAENIAFGIAPEKIDRKRLEQAARTAQIHDYVMQEMPQGYDSTVGERGVRLSGGQPRRQRCAQSRACLGEGRLHPVSGCR